MEKLRKGRRMNFREAKKICVNITASYEGTGYDRVVGNFDGQGFTFGLFGFCLGQGSLQSLVRKMHNKNPEKFSNACTVFVPHYGKHMNLAATLLEACTLSPSQAVEWAKDRQKNNVPDPQWKAVFSNLGNISEFREVQIEAVQPRFIRARDYCVKYKMPTVRALALFFDCTIQQGSLKAATTAKIAFRSLSAKNYKERMTIIAQEMANQANPKWRQDVLSRRMAIVRGWGTVHGRQYFLDREFDLSDSEVDFNG